MVLAIIIVLISIAADQVSKILAVRYLMPIVDFPLWDGVLHLYYLENRGAAFGMLQGARWFFLILSFLVIVAMAVYAVRHRKEISRLGMISLALIVGGAIGNLIDRVIYGYVRDFIYVKIIDFAVFNIADACITVGAILLGVYIIFFYKENKKTEKTETPEAHPEETAKEESRDV